MSRLKNRIIAISLLASIVLVSTQTAVYGGAEDSTETMSTQSKGSTGLWIWDIRNGSWYNPTVQVQGGVTMLPQVYFKATNLPSQGQIAALVSNTTGGLSTGVLQKLDINSWSWSFPTTNFQSSARTAGYSMLTVDNTVYTYGGLSVDANGYPNTNAIQNTLSLIDTNSFQWSPGSNGLGLTDHSTCYLKKCNCLVTFGGTRTGNPNDVTDAVNLYDLTLKVWNVQGITTSAGSPTPGARRLHTSNCLDDIMIIYGGGTTQPADTDIWILNATAYPTLAWQRMNIANSSQGPNLRMGHSSVYDDANKKIYMYGGWGVSATNDSNMYVLDVIKWSWTRVPTTGYPKDAIPPTNIVDPNNPNTDNSNDNDDKKMSVGAIVGAAVGSLVGLLAIAALVLFCIRKKRKEKQEDGDGFSENIQHHELKDNNPYHNNNGYYNNEDAHDDDRQHMDQGYYTTTTNYNNATSNNKRSSNGWHHQPETISTRNSFARRSEIGDSDRVVTGILEEMNDTTRDDGTVGATHGSRSPRQSFRNSKVLLVTPTEYTGQGQVPNEIISQKPNEFSIPTNRFQQQHQQQQQQQQQQNNITVDHHHNSMALSEEGAPLSSSMEVLRSIKTNGSSMMNHPGSHVSIMKRTGVPVTHATVPLEDDENWTFADSLSVNPAIQYILPNSRQLSTDTSTQTWDTKDQRQMVDHHYPSSTLNMPLAQAVTPPTTTNSSSSNNSSNTHELRGVNIYNTVSPLDVLASLGQQADNNTPSNSRDTSSTILKSPNGKGTITTTSSTSTTSSAPDEQQFQSLTPLINALPRRYQLDKSKAPITGPTNNILFVTHNQTPVAIKSFARREAWERECRTLIKLKSPCVVEILEVLTIQNDQINNSSQEEQEGEIKYVTVMQRLDETLSSFIRNSKRTNTAIKNGKIARDILGCLSWCHGNGIAFCDLKPSNIMHNQDEGWKLIDFEASRTINEECVGVITPRYCPPEVARATTYGLEGANGVVATASVDLWSFGCVIYELETKKPLFGNTMKDETILHFISHPSPSTPILNNGLRWNENKELEIPQLQRLVPDPQTRLLIKTLLCREPSKRGSASQLLVS
ncbi:hypothetical protein INT48_004734 [Thamnidium elegans]|uniref:Protein kinase domain-containing protein n=1 Tax=Thamnidium elegans TaxID=101142 RepID=A0A8H7VXQ9_9FUNG|nr:hypothetical protein INT48_004734 [Thamnidium elegans]